MNVLYGYFFEAKRRERLKEMFGQYIPEKHIDEMLQMESNFGLHGEDREMTVLFADIRNFTAISEKLSASQLKDFLYEIFTPMTEIIFKHRGTIDKYIGDCIMAFWNAPLDDPDHARNAVAAAIEMRGVLAALNRRLSDRHLDRGTPYRPLAMAIGINTGECCVGNMGSPHRFDYSILGDAVNVASRLAEFAASHDLDIAMGEDTAAALPADAVRFVEQVVVRGRKAIVRVFAAAARAPDGVEKRPESAGPSCDVAPGEVLR